MLLQYYFEILGVNQSASSEDIKAAYKALIKANHPDKFQNSPDKKQEAEEIAKVLNAAYKTTFEYSKKVEEKFLSVSALRKAIKPSDLN